MKSHAQERAYERYAKELDFKALNQLKNSIRNKEYLYIGTSKDDKTKHFVYVKYNNIPYKVLFTGEQRIRIITIYPFDADEYNNLVEEKRINKYIKYLQERGYICQKI